MKALIWLSIIIIAIWSLFSFLFIRNPNTPTSGSASFLGMAGLGFFIIVIAFILGSLIIIAVVSKVLFGKATHGKKIVMKPIDQIFKGTEKASTVSKKAVKKIGV